MALYCEPCYSEYHTRGHRKLHTYKRIRYATGAILPNAELAIEPVKKENIVPNVPAKNSVEIVKKSVRIGVSQVIQEAQTKGVSVKVLP